MVINKAKTGTKYKQVDVQRYMYMQESDFWVNFVINFFGINANVCKRSLMRKVDL